MTERDIENKLAKFHSNSTDIADIFNEITGLQNSLTDDIMTKDQKNRQLKNIIEKFLPLEVKTILAESWISRRSKPPTREVLKSFLDRHRESINDFIKPKKKSVYKNSKSTARSDSDSNSDDHEQHSHKNTKHKVHKIRKESKSERERENISYYSESEEEWESDQGIHKLVQSKAHSKNYIQSRKDLQCTLCKRKGHVNDKCFRHPDKEIALKNQQARNIHACMLCSTGKHLSPNCTLYPGIIPSYTPCTICEDNGNYERFHPTSQCKQGKEKDANQA